MTFVSYFLTRPTQAVEENLQFIAWLGIIYNTYWTHLMWVVDQKSAQEQLDEATQQAIERLKEMMDRHYRDVIEDREDVETYWTLAPKTLAEAVAGEGITVKLPWHDDREWPPKKKLRKMVWKKAMTHVAKDLGVSDVALKKHCVKLEIPLPPSGRWVRPRRG